MDHWSEHNDFWYNSNLNGLKRVIGEPLHLTDFGRIPRKKHIIQADDRYAGRVVVQFITDGDAYVEVDGVDQKVSVPFAMLRVPERAIQYGPRTWWAETYLAYVMPTERFFAHWEALANAPLTWPMKNAEEIRILINLIERLCASPDLLHSADLIDRLAETMVLLSMHGHSASLHPDEHSRMLSAEAYIRLNFQRDITIDDLAQRFGFSKTGFYRNWNSLFASSPVELITNVRIEEGRRLLLESRLSVKQIAQKAGFSNPYHFRRMFTRKYRLTPTQYRRFCMSYPVKIR
jgi:AraC-like DNA-binding protein